MENKIRESMKEKFDKVFPEAKILREHELRKSARDIFSDSTIGKIVSVIFLIISLFSIFIYWRYINFNIILSIFLGFTTWIVIIYVFSKIFIKFLGIQKALTEINDKEIEASGKKLEETIGIPIDKFLK